MMGGHGNPWKLELYGVLNCEVSHGWFSLPFHFPHLDICMDCFKVFWSVGVEDLWDWRRMHKMISNGEEVWGHQGAPQTRGSIFYFQSLTLGSSLWWAKPLNDSYGFRAASKCNRGEWGLLCWLSQQGIVLNFTGRNKNYRAWVLSHLLSTNYRINLRVEKDRERIFQWRKTCWKHSEVMSFAQRSIGTPGRFEPH